MELPYKSIWQDLFRTPAPLVITGLMMGLLTLLNFYHKQHKGHSQFNFYQKSEVEVVLNTPQNYAVQGIYNNVVDGDKKIVSGIEKDANTYRLTFEINSHRPVTLYVEGESIELFIVPDSLLRVFVYLDDYGVMDSCRFEGYTAECCRYMRAKAEMFGVNRVRNVKNLLSSENLGSYSKRLDSLDRKEQDFYSAYNSQHPLPELFATFEMNQMKYHKAYLKLLNLGEQPSENGYLDSVVIDNPSALYNYYYYLFLNAYFSRKIHETGQKSTDAVSEETLLQLAGRELKGEVKDVFTTRTIWGLVKKNKISEAQDFLQKYKETFENRKYYRYLKTQLDKKRP